MKKIKIITTIGICAVLGISGVLINHNISSKTVASNKLATKVKPKVVVKSIVIKKDIKVKKIKVKKVIKHAIKVSTPLVYYKRKPYVAPISTNKHVVYTPVYKAVYKPVYRPTYRYVAPVKPVAEVTQPKVLTHYIYTKIKNYKNQGVVVNNPKYNPNLPMCDQDIPNPWVEDQIQSNLKK